MKTLDKSEPSRAFVLSTTDCPPLKKKFPLFSVVVYQGRPKGVLTWGKTSTVLGYYPDTLSLRIAGVELSQDPADYRVLGKEYTCVHGGHILGGDCSACAHDKRIDVIESGETYSFEADVFYRELVEASKAQEFRPKTADILKDVEGPGSRPFAKQDAAVAYVKAITGLGDVTASRHANYYANYVQLDVKAVISADKLISAVSQHIGSKPKVKAHDDRSYTSKSWIWRLDNDRAVQVVYRGAKRPFSVRLYNKEMELFY